MVRLHVTTDEMADLRALNQEVLTLRNRLSYLESLVRRGLDEAGTGAGVMAPETLAALARYLREE